jgi:hypothetical protein
MICKFQIEFEQKKIAFLVSCFFVFPLLKGENYKVCEVIFKQ